MILSILTIIFNRSALKVINMLFLAIMLVITMYFSYIIHTLAEKIADSFQTILFISITGSSCD